MTESRWIQISRGLFRIVSRSQTGKLKISAEKTIELEKFVARHLGRLNKSFESGYLYEVCISNADKTHFVFNVDDGCTVGFTNDQDVRFANVTSVTEGMTMIFRISGGINTTRAPFYYFQ